jgi:hypothetical protein
VVLAGDPGAEDFRALAAVLDERLSAGWSVLAAEWTKNMADCRAPTVSNLNGGATCWTPSAAAGFDCRNE